MRLILSVLLLASALTATGCREGATYLKETPDFPESDGLTRLTYNVRDDRAPVFLPNADSLVYSASGFVPYPFRRGLLLRVARGGSSTALLLPRVQVVGDSTPWLTGPAFSRDGSKIAFVELTDVADMPRLCSAGFRRLLPDGNATACPFSNSSAILRRGLLRVVDAASSAETIRQPVSFCCRTQIAPHPDGELAEIVTVTAHPFQQQFERDSAQLFRPTWSPDGTRVVYSDGLDLYLFDVASGAATVIPNTNDGVWPAWSPDGARIAFTRLRRDAAQTASCQCMIRTGGAPAPIGEWVITHYPDGGSRTGTLVLIDIDGSNVRELGVGDAPAWLPSGTGIVAQRDGRLWRINRDSGAAAPIPGTENGYEPAISPDGQSMAFSRRAAGATHDIVTMRLD